MIGHIPRATGRAKRGPRTRNASAEGASGVLVTKIFIERAKRVRNFLFVEFWIEFLYFSRTSEASELFFQLFFTHKKFYFRLFLDFTVFCMVRFELRYFLRVRFLYFAVFFANERSE